MDFFYTIFHIHRHRHSLHYFSPFPSFFPLFLSLTLIFLSSILYYCHSFTVFSRYFSLSFLSIYLRMPLTYLPSFLLSLSFPPSLPPFFFPFSFLRQSVGVGSGSVLIFFASHKPTAVTGSFTAPTSQTRPTVDRLKEATYTVGYIPSCPVWSIFSSFFSCG